MQIEFLGHAAVLISEGGRRLLVDPYRSPDFGGRFTYRPIEDRVDYVVSTHAHSDHSALDALPGDAECVVDGQAGPFTIERHSVAHDEYGGSRRGGLVDILEISTPFARVVHLSDVGCSPESSLVEALRNPDVLLVPVGGFYTIGAAQAWEWCVRLSPRTTIPIHYRTAACSLPIRDVDPFLVWSAGWKPQRSGSISVHEEFESVILLEPRNV